MNQKSAVSGQKSAYAVALALMALVCTASAQLTVNYNFTSGTTVPDNGQSSDTRTLGGLSDFSNVTVALVLSSPNGGDLMHLGDLYSTLTFGVAGDGANNRTAVLLNRPGRDNTHIAGSNLSSLNVLLDDAAATNIWATNSSTGNYKSDGRLGVNPAGPRVAFSNGDRSNTLADLSGASAPASNKFTLLMADYAVGGTARLDSWGLNVTGTAAASGTMSSGGGTFAISDGAGTTNTLGANVVTTQTGGGPLLVTINGTTDFTGVISGSSAFTKLGTGTITFSGNSSNTYTTLTTVSAGELDLNKNAATAIAGNVLVNGGTLKWAPGATVNQIATSRSITMSSGSIDLNGATQTIVDLSISGGTFRTGTGYLTGTGNSMNWSGGTNTINTGGTVEDPHFTISGGTNTIEAGGLLQIDTGTGLVMTSGSITANSDATTPGRISLFGANTNNITSSGTSSILSSSLTNPGQIDLNGMSRTVNVSSGTLTVTASVTSTGGSLTKTGTGTLLLGNTNSYTGSTTVSAGTLQVDNNTTTTAGRLASTSPINVNTSGTLLLSGSGTVTDRVNNSAAINMGGGTLSIAPTGTGANSLSEGTAAQSIGGVVQTGASTIGMGALTLSASSTLDFGASGVGTMVFASFNPTSGVLNIINYSSSADPASQTSGIDGTDDRLVFNQDESGNLASFSFGGISASQIALGDGFFEITPIPEPTTYVTGALVAVALLISQRRRLRRLCALPR